MRGVVPFVRFCTAQPKIKTDNVVLKEWTATEESDPHGSFSRSQVEANEPRVESVVDDEVGTMRLRWEVERIRMRC